VTFLKVLLLNRLVGMTEHTPLIPSQNQQYE